MGVEGARGAPLRSSACTMAACWVHIKGGSLSLAWGRDMALCVTKDAWIIGQLVTLVRMHVVFVRACLSLPLLSLQSDETIKKWRQCTLRSNLFNQDLKSLKPPQLVLTIFCYGLTYG